MVTLTLCDFDHRILFVDPIGTTIQNCQFKLEIDTYINLNIQNSMTMSTFSVFDHKYFFLINLVQKIKNVSASWSEKPHCQFKLKFGT